MVGFDAAASIARGIEDQLADSRERSSGAGELVTPLLHALDALRATTVEAEAPAAIQAAAPPAARPAEATGIRVSAEKVDHMLDVVGEAVLHHRGLGHLDEEQRITGERLLTGLQDAVIDMRTLPLDSITSAFPRAVRDLALAAGKEVELVITGGETQLDRVILEGIAEPIIHVARNAIAHGIERPEERVLVGKPRTGLLQLRAEQRGGMVAIEISDDGRGASPELLARAHGTETLTDILCAPGFSTAEAVSEIAGHGVGLDAVKAHVERLGGSVEVHSETGNGMTVLMTLPLTLAVLRILLCRRGAQLFALPLASVREVVSAESTASLGGRQSLALGGEAVPLADLAQVIGADAPPLPDLPPAMVVSSSGRVAAVSCDEVIGDQEVVMKHLGPLLAAVPGYLGAAVLPDARVALVLDPSHIMKAHATAVAAPAEAGRHLQATKVLVVDDQFTVRELQRSILETAGYTVETARDGREALGYITGDPSIQMVLTDVQMPGMDGFALLQEIRKLPEHATLPVAIITSLDGEDDRRRGVEGGADAYIVKQQFDQQTLLDTVARLVGR
jgi:two-component system chemotaxis sensor kinase CheA